MNSRKTKHVNTKNSIIKYVVVENIEGPANDAETEENIVISIDTSEDMDKPVYNSFLDISDDFVEDNTPMVLNYQLNFTNKQLLQICEYYGLAKLMKQQKFNKDEIIMMLVNFETDEKNSAIVQKRQLMWYFASELREDPFMRKFMFFW
jgi:hypothetical protein